MITAGIDVGAKVIKAVILKDGKVLSKASVQSGREKERAVNELIDKAASKAGISRGAIAVTYCTGAGAKRVTSADERITPVGADARGAVWLFPTARTVIDVGAEEVQMVKCTGRGRAAKFVTNEKCAAGAGTFIETVARALEVKVEEMGPLSLKSEKALSINAHCSVFAESEVVSLIHSGEAKEDIAHAVHDAIATRIKSVGLRIGLENDVVLSGGVARDAGFVEAVRKALQVDLFIPEEPEYLSALGAALAAADARNGSPEGLQ